MRTNAKPPTRRIEEKLLKRECASEVLRMTYHALALNADTVVSCGRAT